MRLVDNWRTIIKHAWSFKLNLGTLFCLLLIGFDYFWPYLGSYLPLSAIWFGFIGALLTVAALVARIVYQTKLSGNSNADQQDQADRPR